MDILVVSKLLRIDRLALYFSCIRGGSSTQRLHLESSELAYVLAALAI